MSKTPYRYSSKHFLVIRPRLGYHDYKDMRLYNRFLEDFVKHLCKRIYLEISVIAHNYQIKEVSTILNKFVDVYMVVCNPEKEGKLFIKYAKDNTIDVVPFSNTKYYKDIDGLDKVSFNYESHSYRSYKSKTMESYIR